MRKWSRQIIKWFYAFVKGEKEAETKNRKPGISVKDMKEPDGGRTGREKTGTVAEILCKVEQFLEQRYEFRFNMLTEVTEFRQRENPTGSFRTVGQRELNSLCIAARKKGIDCWDRDVSRYVHSEDILSYHPIRGFMEGLPAWDGCDRVTQLAKRVSQSPLWIHGFRLWMRGMVAQWMEVDRMHGNSVAPVLISLRQGQHKSTFCKLLLPQELQAYYTDHFSLTGNSNAEHKMSAFALINLDEMDKLSDPKMALLKSLMQMAGINIRKAHKKSHTALPRMASFIATSNRKDILCDPTGSRRFLCVEVEKKIDTTRPDHAQLYAQLKQEVVSGQRFWFTADEEKALQLHNQAFQRRNITEDIFWNYFRLPQQGEENGYLSAASIFDILKKKCPAIMRDISANNFGRVLVALGIERVHTRWGNLYKIIKIND